MCQVAKNKNKSRTYSIDLEHFVRLLYVLMSPASKDFFFVNVLVIEPFIDLDLQPQQSARWFKNFIAENEVRRTFVLSSK